MRTIDFLLFGPPILIGLGGWLAVWLQKRSFRRQIELEKLHGAAE